MKGVGRDMGRRTAGMAGMVLAAVLTVILTWNYWFVQEPLRPHSDANDPLEISNHDVIFEIGSGSFVSLKPKIALKEAAEVKVVIDDPDVIDTIGSFTLQPGQTRTIFLPIHSKKIAGHCVMSFQSKSKELENIFKIRVRIKVVHQIMFGYLSILLGWGYFLAWGASYYPQLYQNWKRRSVVGFSFDYLLLNFTGHLCFCIFNISMYYNNSIQKEYTKLHPKGLIPVHINDLFFSVHAVTLNIIFFIQCLVLERGDQKVSFPMTIFVGGLWVTMFMGLAAAIMEKVTWLQFLYYLSYIKVGTTPIKYTPQVYLNYMRQSTEGWSIQSATMDGGGGLLCVLQMAVDAFNNDDWDGTVGNPAKLGLSFISLIYSCIFLTQHFILYGDSSPCAIQRQRKNTDSERELFLKKLDKKLNEVTSSINRDKHALVHRVQDI